jgi:hypothetical protein
VSKGNATKEDTNNTPIPLPPEALPRNQNRHRDIEMNKPLSEHHLHLMLVDK